MNLFKKRQYVSVKLQNNTNVNNTREKETKVTNNVPDGSWIKCKKCDAILHKNQISTLGICTKCGSYFRLNAKDRLSLVIDNDTFEEFDKDLKSKNPLNFPKYEEKVEKLSKELNQNDAIITGVGKIHDEKTAIAVMDSNFIMGSMGSVVGEKLTRLFEYATDNELPVVVFSASGGARMQEGIISLMQMAKISASVKKHSDAGLLYISFLTDPTTGGVTASFASLGDIILAEPKTLIGFAGRRVIEQTINEKLPDDFQTAEYLQECGFVDKIIKREDIKETLGKLLEIHKRS